MRLSPLMRNTYIARHGQDEDNAEGILNGRRNRPLTNLGRNQAKTLAEEIRNLELTFDAVYASPLLRAYETAEIITNTLNISPPLTLESLVEREFGIMAGKPIVDIERICGTDVLKTDTVTYFLSPDGAETFPELLQRATRTLAEIDALHGDGSVLLVTHGDIGKMLYAAYYMLSWEECLTQFHFGNSELLLLSQDSSVSDSHKIRMEQHNH